jgi:hypothetical protein
VRALDLDPAHPLYAQRLADAAAELSHAQLSGVLDAVYVSRGGARGRAFAELGVAEVHEERVHRSLVTLLLAKVRPRPGAPRHVHALMHSLDIHKLRREHAESLAGSRSRGGGRPADQGARDSPQCAPFATCSPRDAGFD